MGGEIKLAMLAASAVLAFAQSPAFEVASVKPTQHGRDANGWASSDVDVPTPGSLVATNASLQELIQFAYGVKEYQIAGPFWLNDDSVCFDIAAKSPGASKQQMRQMLQTLLADRFQLALHRETRQLPIYNLVVAKSGLKLSPTSGDGRGGTFSRGGEVTGTNVTMAGIAYRLSRELNRPVLDQTGVPGAFDFKFQYSNGGEGPSIFSAIQELGLKLESTKGPMEVLVIDHIERSPTAN
jgi:uncharacterized protein (TIGR03435 family)